SCPLSQRAREPRIAASHAPVLARPRALQRLAWYRSARGRKGQEYGAREPGDQRQRGERLHHFRSNQTATTTNAGPYSTAAIAKPMIAQTTQKTSTESVC